MKPHSVLVVVVAAGFILFGVGVGAGARAGSLTVYKTFPGTNVPDLSKPLGTITETPGGLVVSPPVYQVPAQPTPRFDGFAQPLPPTHIPSLAWPRIARPTQRDSWSIRY